MTKTFCLASLLAFALPAQAQQGVYDRFFTDRTMRFDYYHSGSKGEEQFAPDEVRREGPWPGSRLHLLDTLNLGEYLLRVYDQETGALIFSRGYSSMFNEWQTTGEAQDGIRRTFSETVRFPFPRSAVQVTIARRDRRMIFHELFSFLIDPADPAQVVKETPSGSSRVIPVMHNGDPASKVDIVILGDGYAAADMDKFRADVEHFNGVMFSTEPFKRRAKDFNVWAVEVESGETGIDVPDKDAWKRNALGTRYFTFGSHRYVLSEANKAIRDYAAAAAYDFICILVNDSRYGGGGIYNLYATTYTREEVQGQEWQMDYVYVHEFGHSFAGLGDEYYSSSTAYNDFYPPGVEPWEVNVTAQSDAQHVKWKALLTPGIAVPTPWDKAAYDSVEAIRQKLDRLAPDYYVKREPLYRASEKILKESPYAGKVGVFEGAGYAKTGLYRPAVDCRMFSLSLVGFDPVCTAGIERMIGFYSK
jgi:hypothetical protein